jgi:hypothetical protein
MHVKHGVFAHLRHDVTVLHEAGCLTPQCSTHGTTERSVLRAADGCTAGLLRSHVQLQQAIYTDVSPANACVRLLNATHEVGCAGTDLAASCHMLRWAALWVRLLQSMHCTDAHAALCIARV